MVKDTTATDKLKELMKERGVTPYQLAKDTPFTQPTIYGWCNEEFQPRLSSIKVLAKYFDVPVTDFLKLE